MAAKVLRYGMLFGPPSAAAMRRTAFFEAGGYPDAAADLLGQSAVLLDGGALQRVRAAGSALQFQHPRRPLLHRAGGEKEIYVPGDHHVPVAARLPGVEREDAVFKGRVLENAIAGGARKLPAGHQKQKWQTLEILIPVKNPGGQLVQTAASLAAQADNFVVRLSDNCSQAGTEHIEDAARQLTAAGITVHGAKTPRENKRLEHRNLIHSEAQADWLKLVHAGDVLQASYVELLRRRLAERPQAGLIRCDAELQTEWGIDIVRAPFKNTSRRRGWAIIFRLEWSGFAEPRISLTADWRGWRPAVIPTI